MKIAVPLDKQLALYHKNPSTAPKFAIYLIEGTTSNISFSLSAVFENPWSNHKCKDFADEQINCNCSSERQADMQHLCEHYAILDVIGGCAYLLADKYCENTKHALKNAGVTVYKVPTIINNVNIAIKNFLLGASLASTVQHIHHAS